MRKELVDKMVELIQELAECNSCEYYSDNDDTEYASDLFRFAAQADDLLEEIQNANKKKYQTKDADLWVLKAEACDPNA